MIFPLGVKTSYRAYSADRVKEIVALHKEKYGFRCQDVEVQWFKGDTSKFSANVFLTNPKLDDTYKKDSTQ